MRAVKPISVIKGGLSQHNGKLLTPSKEVPDTKGWVVFSFRMFTPWGTMTSEPSNINGCPWAWFEPFE
jgi:hypothetical protein